MHIYRGLISKATLWPRSLYTLAMDFCRSSASYTVDTCQLYSYIHRNRQSLWSDFSFDTFVPFWLLSRPPARTEFYDSTFWLIGYHGAGTAVAFWNHNRLILLLRKQMYIQDDPGNTGDLNCFEYALIEPVMQLKTTRTTPYINDLPAVGPRHASFLCICHS